MNMMNWVLIIEVNYTKTVILITIQHSFFVKPEKYFNFHHEENLTNSTYNHNNEHGAG